MQNVLPEEYWNKQNYLMYCNNILISILKYADRNKISTENIKFNNEEEMESFKKQKSCDIISWMQTQGYTDEVKKLYRKHIAFSLLSDLCSYTYESFMCAEKGKLSVAYTLLRKPFKDNLFYLEWILADEEDFFHYFINNKPENYDSSSRHFSFSKKKDIIKKASQNIYSTMFADTLDFMYEIRYDKRAEHSLERLWNKSTHLITTCKHYHTGVENFNFIFSTEEDHMEQWDFYYNISPYLIGYVVEVVEAIILRFISIDDDIIMLNQLLRTIQWLALNEKELGSTLQTIIKEVDKLGLEIYCNSCKQRVKLNKFSLIQSKNNWEINCPKCSKFINISRYIFA